MKVYHEPLSKRLHDERLSFFKKIDYQRRTEEMIDFVLSNSWLQEQEKAEVNVSVSTFIRTYTTITVSNINLAQFIEEILGPIHLKYNIWWRMNLRGDVNSPVFEFEDNKYMYSSKIVFRVKEGEFKVCKFINKVISFTQPEEARPNYRLEMICE